MPRYIVQARIERSYQWNPFDDEMRRKGRQDLRILPTEWLLEMGPEIESPDPRNPDVPHPTRSVVGVRPMAVMARNETEAAEAVIARYDAWRDEYPSSNPGGGWRCVEDAFSVTGVRREASTPRQIGSFEVDFAKLVAPDVGPHHLATDQMFELFRWMIRTSEPYHAGRHCSVHRMLKVNDGSWSEGVYEIDSRANLMERLRAGVLSCGHDIYDMWREEHGIAYGQKATIRVPHYAHRVHQFSGTHGGQALCDSVWWAMKDVSGHRFGTSPNSVHPEALVAKSFRIIVSAKGFTFRINYGFDDAEHGSKWGHDLATTRFGETFYETAERAMTLLFELLPTYRDKHRWREAA